MLNAANNIVFKEAETAKRKFGPVKTILFFVLIFYIYGTVISILSAPLYLIWSNEAGLPQLIMEEVRNFNADSVTKLTGLLTTMPVYLIFAQLILNIVSIIIAFFFMKKIEKRPLASAGFVRKGALINYIAGYALGAVMISAACGLIVITGMGSLKVTENPSVLWIVLFFLGYLIQGMGEEVMCRGFLMVSLRNGTKKKGLVMPVIVSSLVFAILHMGNPGMTFLSFFNLFLAGVSFAVMFIRFDNIWICGAAHSAWNFFQGHILGAQVSGMAAENSIFTFEGTGSALFTGGSFGFEGGFAVTIVLLISIALMIFIPSKKKQV